MQELEIDRLSVVGYIILTFMFRAELVAAGPVGAGRARQAAVGPGPARGAHAAPAARLARRVVEALAPRTTVHAVVTVRTLCLASDTCPTYDTITLLFKKPVFIL